jgi:hypothetical protein
MFAKRVLDSIQHTDHMDAGSHTTHRYSEAATPQPFFVIPNLVSVHMICNA